MDRTPGNATGAAGGPSARGPSRGTISRAAKVRVTVAVALVAIGSLVFASLNTPARSAAFRSKVTIKYNADTGFFTGTVKAKGPCTSGRTVTVHKKSGRKPSKKETIAQSATTSPSGKWGPIENTRGEGRFYAKVAASSLGGYGDPTKCVGAKSRSVTVR